MSNKITTRIVVDREVWAEVKAEATRRNMHVKDFVGEVLRRETVRKKMGILKKMKLKEVEK